MVVDKMIKYTQRILKVMQLKKHKNVLAGRKASAKVLARDQWELGVTNDVNMEQFWTWEKTDALDGLGNMYLGPDRCRYFEKCIWFKYA